jgi:hypothetical protein
MAVSQGSGNLSPETGSWVPILGNLGKHFPALVRTHLNAVDDRIALQLHRRVLIRFQRQVAALGIAFQEPFLL